jgi:hypothetical protein
VVFGVMMLEIELEQSNHLSAMAAKLSELSGIATNAVDCNGPDFTYPEITGYLSAENSFPAIPLPAISNRTVSVEQKLMVMRFSAI